MNSQAETTEGPASNHDRVFAIVALGAVIASSIIIGVTLANNGLADLDTCWLLAAGRGVVQLHSLPVTDAYSYTFESLHRPFVMHSWLCSIIFYLVCRLSGFNGLVLLCTILISTAFSFLPLKFAGRSIQNPVLTYLIIAVAPVASLVRFFARPELFSYVCLSLWFIMFNQMKNRTNIAIVPWKFIFAFGIIMIAWANIHSGFALGLALLVYFNIENAVIYFLNSKPQKIPFNFAPLLALAISLPATLINPYGIELLTYNAGMFNSPSKAIITEMLPIAPEHLASSALWPFLIFLILCFTNAVRLMSQEHNRVDKSYMIQKYFAFVLMAASVVVAFSSRRFVSFCVLTLMYELIALNIRSQLNITKQPFENHGINDCLRSLGLHSTKLQMAIGALAVLTTTICFSLNPLEMPQTVRSSGFTPPFAALEYIIKNKPKGNLYNDPFFGSMLIWYSPRSPKVFIDTRFDMYEFDFLSKFDEAMLGHDYQTLFDRYKISWVFIEPLAPLADVLSHDPSWKQLFRDDTAVIFKKVTTKI